jgi:glycosyltransferase involved in cell wall biosynthesis
VMRVLVITDAWHPQVNGVVRTYERLGHEARKLGFDFSFLGPDAFTTIPCPTYPEIRLALATPRHVAREIESKAPDFIHIATEGPLGLMARSYCRKRRRPFTTSYHTRFPEYIAARLPVPKAWSYRVQRWFHDDAAAVFVPTPSIAAELAAHGFRKLMLWSRGVDTTLFRPRSAREFGSEPVFIYVGRIAVEKNIEAFLTLDLPGRKVLVGDGPQLAELRRRFPDALFTGHREGEALAKAYASADVFVFPSLTDTFGLVLLEALASGVPVAAFPVCGPKDVITDPSAGSLNEDLGIAARSALSLSKNAARAHALHFSWENSAQQFLENMLEAQETGLIEAKRLRRWLRRKKEGGPMGGYRAA